MADILVRRAAKEDLAGVYAVYHEEVQGQLPLAPVGPEGIPPIFPHELATGEVYVASAAGEVVGYAATVRRGDVVFLAEFFVRPPYQGRGIGADLLRRVLPRDGPILATAATDDVRAQGLYVKAGMVPLWPFFLLRAPTTLVGRLDPSGVEVSPVEEGDRTLLRWDRGIGGRLRPQDHMYWVKENAATALWFLRDRHRVGYGYVRRRNDEAPPNPDDVVVGPLGVRRIGDALACVAAAMEWARGQGQEMQIGVPGPHAALGPLLKAGFRIVYVDTFMCSDPKGFADPRRYIPSGGSLF